MIRKLTKLIFVCALISVSATSNAQNIRGFYLQDFDDYLGNSTEENKILAYAQGNGFNYILFYSLGQINWNSATEKNQLAAFIHKAKTQYGIIQVGGVVEYAGYVSQKIIPYNNSRSRSTEKFDVINQEFEFWVKSSIANSYCSKFLNAAGYSCDTAGAFKFAIREFKKIDDLCAANGMISEYYIGWPNEGQMRQIASRADRMLLSAYRPTDSDIYRYSTKRMKYMATLGGTTKILTLLSAQSSYMGPWLNSHPVTRPYQTMKAALAAETGSFKNHIDLQGYQYFTYKYLPKTIPSTPPFSTATASISASGPLDFCAGGSVTLTANSGSAYLWSPGGETTRSITVSTPGSYTVRVTNSSGDKATSSPAVVSNSSTIPTITASGSTSFCPGDDVTLTSSSASSYEWSNGETTQSITVSASGSYTVTTGGNCGGTSSPVVVNASSAPTVPTISASGSTSICPGEVLVLTSSPANSYVWSNGATTRSIAVTGSGSYSVDAYSGANCYASSDVETVTEKSAPAQPTISVSGSTTLTSSNTSVVLTSSSSSAYRWSNGSSRKSITVTSQGSYMVTVTSSNGCKATSSAVQVSKGSCTPPPVPTITVNGSTVLYAGESVKLTSSSAGGYLWSTGSHDRSITVNTPGTYTVRNYNRGYCYSTSLPITITVLQARISNAERGEESASSVEQMSNLNAYPNPVREQLNLSFGLDDSKTVSVIFSDVTGREIMAKEIQGVAGENNTVLDVSHLTPGIYFASLISGEFRKSVRVIVE